MSQEEISIDDLLTAGTTSQIPPTSESKEETYEDGDQYLEEDLAPDLSSENETKEEAEQEPKKEAREEHDDYGNVKTSPKTYTEEEVNERINRAVRERLNRGSNQNQATAPQNQNQSQGFDYDPESSESWEAQLEQFVEKTVSKIGQRHAQQQQQMREQQQQAEFEDKFTQGMGRFGDFRDVVGAQPITDPMTYALRGMNDPAAFIYAASKRAPAELQRISNIPDPTTQIMEMGRLEERMRKTQSGTNAPKPLSRSVSDSHIPSSPKKTEPTIEDLIAKSDAKRRFQLTQRRK